MFGPFRGPDKANAKLVVHPDRVLTHPIAFEGFESVAGRCPQIGQDVRRVQQTKLAAGNLDQVGRAPLRTTPLNASLVRESLKLLIMTKCIII